MRISGREVVFDRVKIRIKTANIAEINEKQRPRTRASREVGDGAITITDTGSALNISGVLTVGDQSSGSLNIVNGASVSVGGLSIGIAASGSGNVVIGPGSHLTLTSTNINVGLAGSAVLDVQGGTLGLASGTTLAPGTFGRIVSSRAIAVSRSLISSATSPAEKL